MIAFFITHYYFLLFWRFFGDFLNINCIFVHNYLDNYKKIL